MAGDDGERRKNSVWPLALVVVGLMVGLGGGTVAAWALKGDSSSGSFFTDHYVASSRLPETDEAADAFLAAWERSRRTDYIVVTEWHRATTAGAEATESRVLAQRLPDRIRAGTRNRSGRIGHTIYTCDELPLTDEQLEAGDHSPPVECRHHALDPSAIDDRDPEAMVADEVELMRRHVEGTYPLYRVSQDGNCFYLRLARLMLVPPYGYHTTFCFDDESGAVQALKVERAEGTDTEELQWVQSEVTDDDLIAIIEGTFIPDP